MMTHCEQSEFIYSITSWVGLPVLCYRQKNFKNKNNLTIPPRKYAPLRHTPPLLYPSFRPTPSSTQGETHIKLNQTWEWVLDLFAQVVVSFRALASNNKIAMVISSLLHIVFIYLKKVVFARAYIFLWMYTVLPTTTQIFLLPYLIFILRTL